MGNALRFLYSCCKPSAADDSDSLRPHGVAPSTAAVSRLAHDLLNFETTSQVPDGLGSHVVSSKKAQAKWYRKLLEAWRQANPPPRTTEEASRLVVQALIRHQKADVEGLLGFYGLPLPHKLVHQSSGVPTSLPPGTKFEMQTLPVDPKAVVDGDGMTVYVDASEARESSCIPREVLVAAIKRSKARTNRNFDRANKLHEKIIEAGYRGIDAPETKQPYGKESQEELAKIVQGKCLRIFVYDEDQYGRIVGDIYCDGMFVQELMLKKGMAWHYAAFDQRIELASWENDARAKRVGLWASSNPQQPWDWRRKNPREG